MVLPANVPEQDALRPLLADVQRHGEPAELLIDRAYLGSPVVEELRHGGVAITARPWPSRNAGRFTKEDFDIRLDRGQVTCPADQRAPLHGLGSVAHFPASACDPCSLRARCTVAAPGSGRSLTIHPQEDLLIELRRAKKTPEGRAALRQRVGIEHSLARIKGVQGVRARYKGARKNTLDLRRCAAVANLQRLARAA